MEVKFSYPYPSNMLSNLYPHQFILDGYTISSMEGFLQALTHENPQSREKIIRRFGVDAKHMSNPNWKERQLLFWDGIEYDRHSPEYQELLDSAYMALFEYSEDFRKALQDTGSAVLTHSMGSIDPYKTILTKHEFCTRLNLLKRLL